MIPSKEVVMFKHILVPTDGSDLSLKAAAQAVTLAKATGAKITAFYAGSPYIVPVIDDDGSTVRDVQSRSDYEARVAGEAETLLNSVRRLANAGNVVCNARYTISDSPADAIVRAAEEYGCDGIMMGSHGRTGWRKFLLGSIAQKTLVSTKLPVVVVH
jgi:nucleotide-binding universal stress UspA family protein